MRAVLINARMAEFVDLAGIRTRVTARAPLISALTVPYVSRFFSFPFQAAHSNLTSLAFSQLYGKSIIRLTRWLLSSFFNFSNDSNISTCKYSERKKTISYL